MMEKVIIQAGFESVYDFFLKVAIPGLFAAVGFFFVALFFLPLPFYVSYLILGLGVSLIFAIPYALKSRMRVNINEHIHLFITFAGTISTIDIDRKTFFEKVAQNPDYGQISRFSDKILYFAKKWNLGFSYTCRRIAKDSPSRVFADFLDRLAAALDFGTPLDTFLYDEQKSVLDDYETVYREALNNIGMLREAFIAITISVAFGMSTALLLPLLMGVSIVLAIKWCLLVLFVIDIFLLIFVSTFIPHDDLCHDLKIKDEGMRKVYFWLKITVPISLLIMAVLFYIDKLEFLLNIAFGLIPLLLVGF